MLKLFSCLLITVTFPISMGYTLRTVQEYERGVIFRMGRLKKKSTIGPGMYFIIPCIDKVKVQFNTIFFLKNALSRLQIFTSSLQRFHLNWGCAYTYLKGGFLAKSGKLIFQGRSSLEGKIQKNGKKFFKKFIVPNRSYRSFIYL